jgi:hypothetical protein
MKNNNYDLSFKVFYTKKYLFIVGELNENKIILYI